ncbi:hypothetical protein ABKU49_05980 [Enterobacter hormaechei]
MAAQSSTKRLTMAQIYVLRRMASGTKYSISGDFRRSLEHRSFMGRPDHITCRSSPVLFRLGLTELVRKPECLEKGRYYMLTLSAAGYDAIRENADRSD